MEKTSFAGLTVLDPSDSLSEDGFSFQALNPKIIDALLRLAVVTHRHDAHAALPNPTDDPLLGVLNVGGHIAADTSITVGYTLIDADGGETALNTTPQVITTQAGLADPGDAPALAADTAAGTLLAGSYTYAITVTDGLGGETALGPTRTVVIPTGSATNEVVISGMVALVTASGGTGWRLWRSVNGGTWALINDGVTDTVTDDGSLCADSSVVPPDTTTGTTNATSRLQVTVPAPQDAAAVSFRIYATLDGTFASPALLGEYPVADLATVKTYDDLNFLTGSPPFVSLAKPGATLIDANTEIANLSWRGTVADAAALPTVGNVDGDVRATLDDHTLHIWDDGATAWVAVGGGGGITKLDGSGLVPAGYTASHVSYWKDSDGAVHLEGVIFKNDGTAMALSELLMTLPAGYRPTVFTRYLDVLTLDVGAMGTPGDAPGSVQVGIDGTVRWRFGTATTNEPGVSLDGVVFQP
jgi:hypothetical protein